MYSDIKDVVSVIIPVYNTVNELSRCLQSVTEQTYKNLEIIIIDDGSTDGSGLIVDEFGKVDSRIKIVHQKNAGESKARNKGLSMVTGDYLAFVDCDDWLERDMYEVLVTEMQNKEVDLVAAGWFKDWPDKSIEIKNDLPVARGVFGRIDLLRYLYKRDSYRGFAYMWNKLYRKSALQDEKGWLFQFDESLKLGGDAVFLAMAALKVKYAVYVDRAFYHYNQRETSGCHTKDPLKLQDWLNAYEIIINLYEKESIPEEIIAYLKRFSAYHAGNFTEMAIQNNDLAAKQMFQEQMRKYEKEYKALNQKHQDRIEWFENLLYHKR